MTKLKTLKKVRAYSPSGDIDIEPGTVLRCDNGSTYSIGKTSYPTCFAKIDGRDRVFGFEKANYNAFVTVSGGGTRRRKTRKGRKQSRVHTRKL